MSSEILYHGSKGGIKGNIHIGTRTNCDFGRGFYAGTNELQTQTLVCNAVSPVFYVLAFEKDMIPEENILRLTNREDWLNFILYNRGYLEDLRGTEFYENIKHLSDNKDIIIGAIADDGFRQALNDYEDNYCTDFVLQKTLTSRDIGQQIVAITEAGCKAFKVIDNRIPSEDEIKRLDDITREERAKDFERYNKIRIEFGRYGKTRAELIKEVKKNEIANDQRNSYRC